MVLVDDLPPDLVGLIIDYFDAASASPLTFATASSSLTFKAAQTIAPWEAGGVFATRQWQLTNSDTDFLLLRTRNDFIEEVSQLGACDRWDFAPKCVIDLKNEEQSCDPADLAAGLSAHTAMTLSCKGVTDASLLSIVDALVPIDRLELDFCTAVTDEGVAMVCTSLPNLRCLSLSWCTLLTSTAFSRVATLRELHTLVCQQHDKLSVGSIRNLHAAPNLTSLDISKCDSVDDAALNAMSRLENLQVLDVSYCTRVTDQGIRALIEGSSVVATTLRSLHLKGLRLLRDASVVLLSRCKQLREVSLSWCTSISDKGAMWLAELTLLERCELGGCRLIGDRTVAAIASLPHLTFVDLTHCARVSDVGLRHLSLSQTMRKVLVGGCSVSADTLSHASSLFFCTS